MSERQNVFCKLSGMVSFFKGMYAYHAFTKTDLDHGVDHGSILTGRDVSWNAGQAL